MTRQHEHELEQWPVAPSQYELEQWTLTTLYMPIFANLLLVCIANLFTHPMNFIDVSSELVHMDISNGFTKRGPKVALRKWFSGVPAVSPSRRDATSVGCIVRQRQMLFC